MDKPQSKKRAEVALKVFGLVVLIAGVVVALYFAFEDTDTQTKTTSTTSTTTPTTEPTATSTTTTEPTATSTTTTEPTATSTTTKTTISTTPYVLNENILIQNQNDSYWDNNQEYNLVTELQGNIEIYDNNDMTTIESAFPNLKTLKGTLTIMQMNSLTAINGFKSLEFIEHTLQINLNPLLTEIKFENLKYIGQFITIKDNNNPSIVMSNFICYYAGIIWDNCPSTCKNFFEDQTSCDVHCAANSEDPYCNVISWQPPVNLNNHFSFTPGKAHA